MWSCKNNELTDMETVCKVIKDSGNGYAAVDCENRVDMTQMQSVMDFCDSVENQKSKKWQLSKWVVWDFQSIIYRQKMEWFMWKDIYYGYKDELWKVKMRVNIKPIIGDIPMMDIWCFLEFIFQKNCMYSNIKFWWRACSIYVYCHWMQSVGN